MEDVCHNKRIKSRKIKHVNFLSHFCNLGGDIWIITPSCSWILNLLNICRYLTNAKSLDGKEAKGGWLAGWAEATSVTLYPLKHNFFAKEHILFRQHFIHWNTKNLFHLFHWNTHLQYKNNKNLQYTFGLTLYQFWKLFSAFLFVFLFLCCN